MSTHEKSRYCAHLAYLYLKMFSILVECLYLFFLEERCDYLFVQTRKNTFFCQLCSGAHFSWITTKVVSEIPCRQTLH